MATGHLSKAEALDCLGCKHACHVMLYSDTQAKLFGKIPFKHIILMQMRFDGLLGFPGGLVDPSEETLEAGLSRELLEEVGVAVPISVEDHVESCFAPSTTHLILHFYVKKMEEEQIRELERAAASTATDHGHEVMGMVRIPLYSTKRWGGLASFLSHSFIGNARSQLVNALLRFGLVTPKDLNLALSRSLNIHAQNAEDLQAALAHTETRRKRF